MGLTCMVLLERFSVKIKMRVERGHPSCVVFMIWNDDERTQFTLILADGIEYNDPIQLLI